MHLSDEVLAKYKSRRKNDLEICRQALQTRDYAPIGQVGHNMKGNGVTFGFPELSKLGEELEFCVEHNDVVGIQKAVESLAEWVLKMVPSPSSTSQ